ncbi:MAG: response regulator transcription factor [Pyrinomonadaceae bacterium]|nr:response regulator transcription factor [Sphingobacteriaceae bacterium]
MIQILNALIIEDEEIVARVLREKIKLVDENIRIIETLPSLKTARNWFLNNAEPDIIFMDIQLSDGVSFDIFNYYTITCPVIFTTAYDEYAIRAFKVNGIDYLLKPIDETDLKTAIDKGRNLISTKIKFPTNIQELIQNITNPQRSLYKEKFIVNVRNRWMPVSTKDIACFNKDVLNYVCLFNGDRYTIDLTTLDEVEELLDPKQFYRANRQFIINIDAVDTVKPEENSKLIIWLKSPLNKLEVEMSRLKAPLFKKWLNR